ncbi:hypothetical protein [Microviridae sp.]|nr:hypothetical protein [Microviridae sp.]
MHGKQSLPVERGNHRFEVVTPFPLLVSFNSTPVKAIQAGTHKFVLKLVDGVIDIDPTEPKGEYAFNIHSRPSTAGEMVDNLPPPPPPRPDNYLQQVALRVRQSMNVVREAFDDYPSVYETDGELFEEEEAEEKKAFNEQKRKEAKKKAVEKAKAKSEGSPPEKAETLSQTPENPPTGENKTPTKPD